MLKLSKDRKVTNLVSPNGKVAKIANTFGLPAGRKYSCPGATKVCEKICYAGKLEKIYTGISAVLLHNWNLLKDANEQEMYNLLDSMVSGFVKECDKKKAEKKFRIHWDGDFFNQLYVNAWRRVILAHPEVEFWVYTRVPAAAESLRDIKNLSLYFSCDSENKDIGLELSRRFPTIRLAMLANKFDDGLAILKQNGTKGTKCPENNKKIPLISKGGSACISCGLCPNGRGNVVFSISKK
jgi:hypothetical protein